MNNLKLDQRLVWLATEESVPEEMGSEMRFGETCGNSNYHVKDVEKVYTMTGNEPRMAARILLDGEHEDENFEVFIYNHKGTLIINSGNMEYLSSRNSKFKNIDPEIDGD